MAAGHSLGFPCTTQEEAGDRRIRANKGCLIWRMSKKTPNDNVDWCPSLKNGLSLQGNCAQNCLFGGPKRGVPRSFEGREVFGSLLLRLPESPCCPGPEACGKVPARGQQRAGPVFVLA